MATSSDSESPSRPYVSRAGEKLAFALDRFALSPAGRVAADLGSHVGGFVDCLLQRGVAKVYSVDTSYGTLAWKLRKDERVVVRERTNAMHVELPESISLVTIDVGWTPQRKVLPQAGRLLLPGGDVVSLIKPHYEAGKGQLKGGVVPDNALQGVLDAVFSAIRADRWVIRDHVQSPLRGHGGNAEWLVWLQRADDL